MQESADSSNISENIEHILLSSLCLQIECYPLSVKYDFVNHVLWPDICFVQTFVFSLQVVLACVSLRGYDVCVRLIIYYED